LDNAITVRYPLTHEYFLTHEYLTRYDEAGIVWTAQKGDMEAFTQLVLSYYDRIFTLAVRILGDEDAAEEITQNTFVNAYFNLPRFRNGSFRSWLYRIATNACYDEFRRHTRHPSVSIENEDLAEERFSPLDELSIASSLPEVEVERHELALVIQSALNQLDENQRNVIKLIDQQDFNCREAAQILGIPIGTVKSRLARARQHLYQILNKSNLGGLMAACD
jgi:RNA polymerase sigma-70 factor (ECF subfamily)